MRPHVRRFARGLVETVRERRALGGGGERVDIDLTEGAPDFDALDMYEQSHLRRYEFATREIHSGGATGDFACGTGYGTVMLAGVSSAAIGADNDARVVARVRDRYRTVPNVEFVVADLRQLAIDRTLDSIVSFETLEHFDAAEIATILARFASFLRPGGRLVMSTPYMQEASPEAVSMGFHRTFGISEETVERWLADASLALRDVLYQNYATHDIVPTLDHKDFLICVAERAGR